MHCTCRRFLIIIATLCYTVEASAAIVDILGTTTGVNHTCEADVTEVFTESGAGPPSFGVASDGWMFVDRGDAMHLSNFDVTCKNGAISAVDLMVEYSVEAGYGGINPITYNTITTGITPADLGNDQVGSFDLYGAGITTWAAINALDIEFTNDDAAGPDAVSFDYVWIRVTYVDANPVPGTYTIGPSGDDYVSIGAALAAVNCSAPITGAYIFELQSDYSDVVETYPLVFNSISGASPSNTITFRPASGVSSMVLSSAQSGPVIDVDGGDYFIWDGRPGGTGSLMELTIRNTKTSSVIGPVFQLRNDAVGNTLTYLKVEGDNAESATTGLIVFGTTTGTSGNDDNTISYCHIKDWTVADGGTIGLPRSGIYSLGTTAKANSGNTIDNCEIYDIFNTSIISAYIHLDTETDNWTITNNHFYQTGSMTGASMPVSFIYVRAGGGYIITGNYLGGQAPNAGGSPFSLTQTSFYLSGIEFGLSCAGAANTISGNTITNISYTTTTTLSLPVFTGIMTIGSSDFTVGSVGAGNTIGSISTTGDIMITNDATSGSSGFEAITIIASGSNTVAYNSIGGITIDGTHPGFPLSALIEIESGAGATIIDNNILGGTIANSIQTPVEFQLWGIRNNSPAGITCTNNTLQNWSLSYGAGSNNVFYAMDNSAGSLVATDNILKNLSSAGANTMYGITHGGTSATITNNTIQDITVSNTGGSSAFTGIYSSTSGGTTIDGNTIGSATNNNISLGNNGTGISVSGASTKTVSNNTIQEFDLTNTGATGSFVGIRCSGGILNANSNTIQNIDNVSVYTGSSSDAIFVDASGTSHNISKNIIKNVNLTTTTANAVLLKGIRLGSGAGGGTVEKNMITGLTNSATSAAAEIKAIAVADGSWNIENNVIILDNAANTNDLVLNGMDVSSTGTNNIYHNTIAVAGTTAAGATNTHALYRTSVTGTATVKNNLFQNMRTGGSGKHYTEHSVSTGTYTTNYNYVENPVAAAANVCHYGGSDYTLGGWQGVPVNATNSLSGTTTLDAEGGAGVSFAGANMGTDLSATVPEDRADVTRDATPWLGAYEGACATATTADAGYDLGSCGGAGTMSGNTPLIGTGIWSLVSGAATIATPTSSNTDISGIPMGTSTTLRWTITNGGCGSTLDDVMLTVPDDQPGDIDACFNSSDYGFNIKGRANNDINSVAVQPDGKILICGSFTKYDGISRNRVARIHPNGDLDLSFDPGTGMNNWVDDIALQSDNKIIVVGNFSTVDGVARANVARLNTDGSHDLSFNPGTGSSSIIVMKIQSDDKIILGGNLTAYDGNTCGNLVRIEADGAYDATFNTVVGASCNVYSMLIQDDGKIVIGGCFVTYDGVSRNRIARVNSDGSLDTGFDPGTGVDNTVYAIGIQSDGKVIIRGPFTTMDGVSSNYIARLTSAGARDATFNMGTGFDGSGGNIHVLDDDKITVSGFFSNYNGSAIESFCQLNSDGTINSSFDPGNPGSYGYLAALSDGSYLVYGSFTTLSNAAANHIAKISSTGVTDVSFNPETTGANGSVACIAIQSDGKIILGGYFTSFNGKALNKIVRLNINGTVDASFNIGSGFSDEVKSLAIQSDGKIMVGGYFTQYNGTARELILRLNPSGSIDLSFDPLGGPANTVTSINIQSDGKMILAGYFNDYNGTSRGKLCRIDDTGTLDLSYNSGTGANSLNYSAVLQSDGKLILGGQYTTYNGTSRNSLCRVLSDGNIDLTFDPGTGADSYILSTALQSDGKVLIGGGFTTYDGTAMNYFARVNSDGTLDGSFSTGTGPDARVDAIAVQPNGSIIIVGWFTSYNGTAVNRIARINPDGSLDPSFDVGTGADGAVGAVAIQSDWNIIVGGSFGSYDGIGRNSAARIIGGPKIYYWIGDAGDWDDGTRWSYSTGGGGCNCIPTAEDNVIFDSNSFTAAGQIVSMPPGTWYCKSIDFQDINRTPTMTGTGALVIRP